MHSGTVAQGDAWLQANLAAYAQWALTNNSLLVVVWDESDDDATQKTNQVPAILYGANVVPGNYSTAYNDYNLLSTITGAFGLYRGFENLQSQRRLVCRFGQFAADDQRLRHFCRHALSLGRRD